MNKDVVFELFNLGRLYDTLLFTTASTWGLHDWINIGCKALVRRGGFYGVYLL
jgi:hypothetical protein